MNLIDVDTDPKMRSTSRIVGALPHQVVVPARPPMREARSMANLQRIAPIFSVHDLNAAMDHYRRLGFDVRAYSGGGYGYATCDDIEIHLGVVPDDDRRTSSAYLFVDNADDLAEAWRSAGVELHSPEDTEWGRHEGAVVDPDGNVIRFGSPTTAAAER